jgi:hypothetical protein
METLSRLSAEALEELKMTGTYDTRRYRYWYKADEDKTYRINIKLLGTTAALDPENWVEQ